MRSFIIGFAAFAAFISADLLSAYATASAAPDCKFFFQSISANHKDVFEDTDRFVLRAVPKPANASSEGKWYKNNVDGMLYLAKSFETKEELIRARLTYKLLRNIIDDVPNVYLARVEGRFTLLIQTGFREGDKLGSNAKIKADLITNAWLGLDVKASDVLPMSTGRTIKIYPELKTPPKEPKIGIRESIKDPEFRTLYGDISDAEIAGQVRRLLKAYSLNYSSIRNTIARSGLSPKAQAELATSIEKRLDDLAGQVPNFRKNGAESDESLGFFPDSLRQEASWSRRFARKNNLSDGEHFALTEYISTGGNHQEINELLYGNLSPWAWPKDKNTSSRYQHLVFDPSLKLLESGLKKLSDFRGRVLRGIELSPEQIKKYQVGTTIVESGFVSTSKDSPRPGIVQFEILSKHGKSLKGIGQEGEEEVLFLPGSKFRVTTKTYDQENKQWKITLSEI